MKPKLFFPIGGLFFKIASLVSLILIVAVGLTTTLSIREQTQAITTQLIEQNKYLSRHLASSIKSAFWSLNWLFVEKQMQEIARSDEVAFLELLKPNGEAYLSAGDQEIRGNIVTPGIMKLENQILKDGLFSKTGAPIKWIITPVKVASEQWILIMGLSLKGAKQVGEEIILENVILGGSIFILGVLISFIFARGMTSPIRRLVEGTNEIGKGNLDCRIEITGLDEIGDLAASFNKMAEDLKKTTASRDQLNMEVNERKHAEKALRRSERRFRIAAECASDLIYEWDIATDRLQWFGDVDSALGYEHGEIEHTFQSWITSIHPDDLPSVTDAIDREMGSGVPIFLNYRIRRKGGDWAYWTDHAVVLQDESSKPSTLIGVCTDITERKKTEEVMWEREEKFRALTENTSDITGILDEQGTIKYLSPSVERILHYSMEEIIGKKMARFLPPEDLGELRKFFKKALRVPGKTIAVPNTRIQDKYGQWLILETLLTAMTDIPGVNGIVVNSRDITERIRAREENKALEAQLQRAQKMQAIGTLAGGVAHDLNNILSGIVSYPELLLMDLPEDSPLRDPILTIRASGKKAAAIVQDLLTLARRGVSITRVVNLNSIISDYLGSPEYRTLRDFHPYVDIETDLAPDLLNVMGSPVHLGKTVMNLVSNAAEAIRDQGKILITTRNRHIDRPITGYDAINEGDYALLSVSDTGIGISPVDLERIFEPFYTKKVMGRSGTGLGMAVVWGTLKDHHGYIDVQSIEGQGSTFKLYFPVTRKKLPEAEALVSIKDYMGKGEKILIVDDVEEQRKIASNILLKLGYRPMAVSSGEDAVEYLRNHSADLLVLDMIMDPGIDGLETYRRIIDLRPGQRAVITSGFSESEQVKRAQELGAGPYVKKPYTLEQIGLAIRKELEADRLDRVKG